MGRPANFDRDQALQDAMLLFWQKGFNAASVQHILDTMGINRGSLYASFGDKRTLFLEAIHFFHDNVIRKLFEEVRRSEDPIGGIRRFFEISFLELNEEQLATGCLITNTIVEMAYQDGEIKKVVEEKLNLMAKDLEAALVKAQKLGKLDPGKDPKAISYFLISTLQGLRVMTKIQQDKAVIRQVINTALETIG